MSIKKKMRKKIPLFNTELRKPYYVRSAGKKALRSTMQTWLEAEQNAEPEL